MSDNTKIEWADATANYVNGCSVVSPGCTNCYAMRLAGTRMKHHPSRAGLTNDTKAGPVWNGEIRVVDKWLETVLRWRKPRRIFWNAHGDLFHGAVPDDVIDRQFAVMALTPQHIHMVLTKRPERMREYVASWSAGIARADAIWTHIHGFMDQGAKWRAGLQLEWPLPNAWLGTSVEDQVRADERIPALLATPAAVRFISAEPLLGPVNLDAWLDPESACQGCDDGEGYGNACASDRTPRDEQCPWKRAVQVATEHGPFVDGMPAWISHEVRKLDWVIVGGESGPNARPMHPDWARSLRDQCAAAGVPFLFKQWGEWVPVLGAVDSWDLNDDPEQSRFDHRDWEDGAWGQPYRPAWHDETDDDTVLRVGKARAGRLLDGVQHDGFPSGTPDNAHDGFPS